MTEILNIVQQFLQLIVIAFWNVNDLNTVTFGYTKQKFRYVRFMLSQKKLWKDLWVCVSKFLSFRLFVFLYVLYYVSVLYKAFCRTAEGLGPQ